VVRKRRDAPKFKWSSEFRIRELHDDEIQRLLEALGKPIEDAYLRHWISEGIRSFLMFSTQQMRPSQHRDELEEIANRGRQWIRCLEQSRSTQLLPADFRAARLMCSMRLFCERVELRMSEVAKSVERGRPRNLALDSFVDRLIGIAKKAKVLPSAPSREFSRGNPPFFKFVDEAIDLAGNVIKSSGLDEDALDAAVSLLKISDDALIETVVRLRGRIGDYRESTHGLVEQTSKKSRPRSKMPKAARARSKTPNRN
jgi:hypothetical protein